MINLKLVQLVLLIFWLSNPWKVERKEEVLGWEKCRGMQCLHMVYPRLWMRDCSEVQISRRVMYAISVGVWYHVLRKNRNYLDSHCRRCSRGRSFVRAVVTVIVVWLVCRMWWNTWSMNWQLWTLKWSFISSLDTSICYIYEIINQLILLFASSTMYLSGIWRDFNSFTLLSLIFWSTSFSPLKFYCNCWFSTPTIFLLCCFF